MAVRQRWFQEFQAEYPARRRGKAYYLEDEKSVNKVKCESIA